MQDTGERRGRSGGVSAGSVAVAVAAVLACVLAFLVTGRLLEDGEQGVAATTQAPTPPVRCWDGATAAGAGGCREPDASPAAFAWVFPDVDLRACTTRVDDQRTVVKCYRGSVEMNLSRWRSLDEALAYYRAEMGGPGTRVEGGRLVWTAPTVRFGEPKQKSAVMYAAHPWSLTTYADSEAAAVRAQRASWMRPARTLLGTG